MTPTPVRVIGLNGSPHRQGNTATLMGWVLEGCREAGASVEWLHLVDYHIQYCQGCFTCLRSGACPIQDDFLEIRARLTAADGLVLGSPVYEGGPSAQMKTLMDRLTLLHLYTQVFERQVTIGVATSGIAPTRDVALNLADYFGRRSAWIGATTTTLSDGIQPLAERHPPHLPAQARRVGRRLVEQIQNPGRLRLPQPFRLWIQLLRRLYILPLMRKHPDQFAGALRILQEKALNQVN